MHKALSRPEHCLAPCLMVRDNYVEKSALIELKGLGPLTFVG